MLDDGDEEHTNSEDWIELIEGGGLTHINEITFQVFLAMKIELRKCIPNFKTTIAIKLLENEDNAFYWSIWSSTRKVLMSTLFMLIICGSSSRKTSCQGPNS